MRYFPNLDGLRFYAAVCVMFAHMVDFVGHEVPGLHLILLGSQDAVTLFFVLSGFLITYLLSCEREQTGDIHLKRFWMRRILRIWPLYYLLIVLVVVIAPGTFTPGVEALFTALLIPNVGRAFGLGAPSALLTHLWSIGVEEQFYAVYPVIARHVRRLAWFLGGFIALKFVATLLTPASSGLYLFLTWSRFEGMAFGGLAALAYVHAPGLMAVVNRRGVLALVGVIGLAVIVIEPPVYSPIYDYPFAAFAALAVLVVATHPDLPQISAWRPLGNLSYGIYMYHLLMIHLTRSVLGGGYAVVLLMATLGAAWVSYVVFEQPFLLLKRRYSIGVRSV